MDLPISHVRLISPEPGSELHRACVDYALAMDAAQAEWRAKSGRLPDSRNTPLPPAIDHDGQCPDCGGPLMAIPMANGRAVVLCASDCAARDAERREREHDERSRPGATAAALADCGVPPMFRDVGADRSLLERVAGGGAAWVHRDDPAEAACAAVAALKAHVMDGGRAAYIPETALYAGQAADSMGRELVVLDGFGYREPNRREASRLREFAGARRGPGMMTIVSTSLRPEEATAVFRDAGREAEFALREIMTMCGGGE